MANLGVPEWLVEELFARRLLTERISTIASVSEMICVSYTVGRQVAETMRRKKQIEFLGAAGRDDQISLSEAGERRTEEVMRNAGYVVPVPVSIDAYRFVVANQARNPMLNQEAAKAYLSDLVVSEKVLDQLGPAFLASGAIFLYGPPGTGKTSLAERLGRFASDRVLIPRVVNVDGQLISVYDPSIHEPSAEQPDGLDPRWVACKRPIVAVGGELELESLNLQHDSVSGLHTASIQMLANNGLLLVDDFGRQTSTPDQILNRWIIPLSTGVDHLTGRNGAKFTVPFQLKLVLATNLNPADLGDEAFLRRLPNKIFVGGMDEEGFYWTLARSAHRLNLELTSEAARRVATISKHYVGELRPFIAVDFCEIANSILTYRDAPKVLTPEVVDMVVETYFVKSLDEDQSARAKPLTSADIGEVVAADEASDDQSEISPAS
jgi:hypothetical protein